MGLSRWALPEAVRGEERFPQLLTQPLALRGREGRERSPHECYSFLARRIPRQTRQCFPTHPGMVSPTRRDLVPADLGTAWLHHELVTK